MATWLVGHSLATPTRASSHLAVGPKAPPPTSSSKPVKPASRSTGSPPKASYPRATDSLQRRSAPYALPSDPPHAPPVRHLRCVQILPRVQLEPQRHQPAQAHPHPHPPPLPLPSPLALPQVDRQLGVRRDTVPPPAQPAYAGPPRLCPILPPRRHQNTLVTSLIRGHVQQASQKDVDLLVVPPRSAEEKFQVNEIITAIVWESALFLSTETEADELYSILLVHAKLWREQIADAREQDIPTDQDINAARLFTPFLSVFAKRSPSKLLEVVSDMEGLGMKPDMAQWDIIAGAYARFDPVLALRVLDWVEEIELKDLKKSGADAYGGQESHRQLATRRPSDNLLRAHTSVMQKFIDVEDTVHAREVEKRLVERFGYQAGDGHVTDVAIRMLRRREKARESRGLPP
ncbi:hypothetical protein BU15DRAFT_83381 [Melanogaster broomeanus]|nr:hypothetical protein BU15DRAFT_83381 [Melanogaster broomeanus]